MLLEGQHDDTVIALALAAFLADALLPGALSQVCIYRGRALLSVLMFTAVITYFIFM